MVGIVDQYTSPASKSSSYSAFTSKGTNTLVFPLVQYNNGNYYSSLNIQNNSAFDATFTLTTSDGEVVNQTCYLLNSRTVPAGGSCIILQLFPSGDTRRFFKGVTLNVSNPSAQLLAIVNQLNNVGTGDLLSTYEGINTTTP